MGLHQTAALLAKVCTVNTPDLLSGHNETQATRHPDRLATPKQDTCLDSAGRNGGRAGAAPIMAASKCTCKER